MDDAVGVGVLDGVADAGEEAETCEDVEVLGLGMLDERPTPHALHGEERDTFTVGLVDANLKDLWDAGVPESAEDLGLTLESAEEGGGRPAGTDDLEGDGATGALLLGEVDPAHAPLAEDTENPVLAEGIGSGSGLGGGRGAGALRQECGVLVAEPGGGWILVFVHGLLGQPCHTRGVLPAKPVERGGCGPTIRTPRRGSPR